MLFGLFKTTPQREARQLARDADAIVNMARDTYRDSILSDIARLTRNGIAQMDDLAGDDRVRRETELARYKTLHREARLIWRAKRLLQGKGVVFKEVCLWTHSGSRREMLARADGRHTVPQIFVDGRGIGGSDELVALDQAGKLDALLGSVPEGSTEMAGQ